VKRDAVVVSARGYSLKGTGLATRCSNRQAEGRETWRSRNTRPEKSQAAAVSQKSEAAIRKINPAHQHRDCMLWRRPPGNASTMHRESAMGAGAEKPTSPNGRITGEAT